MADRKKVDPRVEALVLAQSARRCCMCFRLRRDLSEKLGQIAHLDHDPANGCEDNLAYLCMDHHSLYDSRTSQHKNYTLTELTEAREDLYREVAATKPTVRLIDRFDQRVEPKATTRNWLIDRIVQLTWQIILAAVLLLLSATLLVRKYAISADRNNNHDSKPHTSDTPKENSISDRKVAAPCSGVEAPNIQFVNLFRGSRSAGPPGLRWLLDTAVIFQIELLSKEVTENDVLHVSIRDRGGQLVWTENITGIRSTMDHDTLLTIQAPCLRGKGHHVLSVYKGSIDSDGLIGQYPFNIE